MHTKSVLWVVTLTPIQFFLMESVYIWHTDCLLCVDGTKVTDCRYDIEV